MKTIKLSVRPVLADIFMRQTPGNQGIWKNCKFYINTPVEKSDWWIVCHNTGLMEEEHVMCDPDHLVYISMEPYDSWLPKGFIDQFSKVVLCDRAVNHPDILFKNGFNWWVGMKVLYRNEKHHFSPEYSLDYDRLSAMTPPEYKTKFMSVITSNKVLMDGHKTRMRFLERLQSSPLADHIDFFGGGINPIDDKWEAILPYKYHLVLENSVTPDYWSEKLADAFLGYAYPVYYGCPNISEYFSADALKAVNIEDFGRTVADIEKLLSSDGYSGYLPAVEKARNQVLNEYNIFNLIAGLCKDPVGRMARCRLKPRSSYKVSFRPGYSMLKRIRHRTRNLYKAFTRVE